MQKQITWPSAALSVISYLWTKPISNFEVLKISWAGLILNFSFTARLGRSYAGIIRTYKSKIVFRLENSDLRLLWKSSSVNCIDDDKVPFICIDKKEIEFLI